MKEKILRSEEKIEKLKERIEKYNEELRIEEERLLELKNSSKLAKVDELMIYFEETNIDMTFDELVDKLKNNKLNLTELRNKSDSVHVDIIN